MILDSLVRFGRTQSQAAEFLPIDFNSSIWRPLVRLPVILAVNFVCHLQVIWTKWLVKGCRQKSGKKLHLVALWSVPGDSPESFGLKRLAPSYSSRCIRNWVETPWTALDPLWAISSVLTNWSEVCNLALSTKAFGVLNLTNLLPNDIKHQNAQLTAAQHTSFIRVCDWGVSKLFGILIENLDGCQKCERRWIFLKLFFARFRPAN